MKTNTKQRIILAIASFVVIVVSIAVHYTAKQQEAEANRAKFELNAKDIADAIRHEITLNLEVVISIGSLFAVSDSMTREEFRVFNQRTLKRFNSIKALEWIPKVGDDDRAAYERLAKADGLEGFNILEKVDGIMVPAAEREEYYPVYFVEPLKGNEKAVGFDMASNPTWLATLDKARKSHALVATSRITLMQESASQKGMLVFSPISKNDEFQGYALGVYRLNDLAKRAIANLNTKGSNIIIYDESADEGEKLLVHLLNEEGEKLADDATIAIQKGLSYQQSIQVADRNWLVVCEPTEAYLASLSTTYYLFTIISVLIGLFIVLVLYVAFKKINLSRESKVQLEHLVYQRTLELEKSNKELEEFAYVASHDLKAPLTNLQSLTGMIDADQIKDEMSKNLFEKVKQSVSKLYNTVHTLNDVIAFKELLKDNKERMNFEEMFDETRESIARQLESTKAKISTDFSQCKVIDYPPLHLRSIMQNLLTNALKYKQPDKPLEIEVRTEISNGSVCFIMKDNGLGFDAKKDIKMVTGLFKRLHTHVEGKGVGMYIVNSIVNTHGGKIEIESEPNKGTIFRVQLN